GGDPARAPELPPLEKVPGTAELELQARRLGRILAFNEDLMSPVELGVMKVVSAWRRPVDEVTVAVAGAALRKHLPRRGAAQAAGLRPGLALRASLIKLAELRFLQAHPGEEGASYSAHPFVSQYYYRALQEDAVLAQGGPEAHGRREMAPDEFQVRT